jgi:hypothetical protein
MTSLHLSPPQSRGYWNIKQCSNWLEGLRTFAADWTMVQTFPIMKSNSGYNAIQNRAHRMKGWATSDANDRVNRVNKGSGASESRVMIPQPLPSAVKKCCLRNLRNGSTDCDVGEIRVHSKNGTTKPDGTGHYPDPLRFRTSRPCELFVHLQAPEKPCVSTVNVTQWSKQMNDTLFSSAQNFANVSHQQPQTAGITTNSQLRTHCVTVMELSDWWNTLFNCLKRRTRKTYWAWSVKPSISLRIVQNISNSYKI